MTPYTYEILTIDNNGKSEITSIKSLMSGLSYSEQLWEGAQIKGDENSQYLEDSKLKITLKAQRIDTSKALSDYMIESAFLIKVKGCDFDKIEPFRRKLLIHLRNKLGFTNIRILTDDVSTELSVKIYPLVNKVENSLRRYLIKFFIQKVGLDWAEVTFPKLLLEKIKLRTNNERTFSPLVDTDITLSDFDDLGELIYKQSSGFNKPERIIEKVMNTSSIEELSNLKVELQGNYTKYFKTAFQDNQFDKKWKQLFDIRNKVAHNNLFTAEDLRSTEQLSTEIESIISKAESKIEEFSFSIEEKEAIRSASIELEASHESEPESNDLEEQSSGKVIDKTTPNKFISEKDLLEELKIAERRPGFKYVGLKSFVTKYLYGKGYSYSPAYSLINILNDKGIVQIYDHVEPDGFIVKAVRSPK